MRTKHFKKVAIFLVATLGIMILTPCTQVHAGFNSQFDQNGDGVFDNQDRLTMLDAILDNKEGIDNSMDINGDGVASIEDFYLYVACVLNPEFVPGSGPHTPIEDLTGYHSDIEPIEAITMIDPEANTFIVKVNFQYPKDTDKGFFDYAILYDKEKVKVEDIEWNANFRYHFSEHAINEYGKKDKDDYVILGGWYCNQMYWPIDVENIATITFSYLNEEKDTGNIEAVAYATEYDDSLEKLKKLAQKVPTTSLPEAEKATEYQQCLDRIIKNEETDLSKDQDGDGIISTYDLYKSIWGSSTEIMTAKPRILQTEAAGTFSINIDVDM